MGKLLKWLNGEAEEEDVFGYTIDLTALANFGPKTPKELEDLNNLLNGIELIAKAFGYNIKKIITISTDGCGSSEYLINIKKELEELEKESCDLLLVKEYDSYVLCLEPSN